MAIKVGTQARLKQPVIQGDVIDARYNHSETTMEYLVTWTDEQGDEVNRWFNEAQLEEVPQ